MTATRRPVALRRSWLFVPGADRTALFAAAECGTDAAIQELEDFTPPERRPEARALSPEIVAAWKAAGLVAVVRINPFSDGGREDLAAVMQGAPDVVALPKVSEPEQVVELDRAVSDLETELGIAAGSTELLPNIESARGLMQTYAIASASPRVTACLVASEDMATDLGAERDRDGLELNYVRETFHVACRAAGVVSVDCPYTWQDEAGLLAETGHARRLGYTAKSAVMPAHAPVINAVLTPRPDQIEEAQRIVAAFETARREGRVNVALDGAMIELPSYANARRLLERAAAFGLV